MKKSLFTFLLTFVLIQTAVLAGKKEGSGNPTQGKSGKPKKTSRHQQHSKSSTPEFCFPTDLVTDDAYYNEKIFPEFQTRELISKTAGPLNKYILITDRNDIMKVVEEVKSKGVKKTTLKYADGTVVKSLYNKGNGDEKICTEKKDGNVLVTNENKFHALKTATIYDPSGSVLEEILMDKYDLKMIRILEEGRISRNPPKGEKNRHRPGGRGTAGKPKGNKIHVQIYRKHRDLNTDEEKGARKTQTRNNGIVADTNSVIVNGFHGYPSPPVDLSALTKDKKTFEPIPEDPGLVNSENNFEYMVHFSPTGSHWRTKNMDIIRNVIRGDHTIINDGGYTEYFGAKRGWSKNDGIIENGQFVPSSKNFHDRGDYFEYQWGGNILRWTKILPNERDDLDLDDETDLIARTHSHITNSASDIRANPRSRQIDPLTRPAKQSSPGQAKQPTPRRKKATTQQTGSPHKRQAAPPSP